MPVDFSFLEGAASKPQQPEQKLDTGLANVTIRVDADCFLQCDGEYIEIELQAGKMVKTQFPIGQHLLEFISSTYPDINVEKVVDFPETGKNYLVLIGEMKEAESGRRNAEEKERLKAEEELRHNAEEERKRKAEEERIRQIEERISRLDKEVGLLEPYKNNGKYGFFDRNGSVVIPCQWEGAYNFSEGLALVRNDKCKYGYIDKSGNVVIPCQWNNAESFRDGLACVKDNNGKLGYIDKSGRLVIPCQWKYACDFSEGLAKVEGDNGIWGYIDKSGRLVIPCQWEDAYGFSEGFSEGLASVKGDNGKYGYINKSGDVVIPCQWEDADNFSEGMARFENDNGYYGFIDKNGNVIIPCLWKYTGNFRDDLIWLQDSDGRICYFDKRNKKSFTVEDVKDYNSTFKLIDGMQFNRGYISSCFVTDTKNMECNYDSPYILICDKKISTADELHPIMEKVAKTGLPFLVIVEDIEGSALISLVNNYLHDNQKIVVVKAPGFGYRRTENLEDIAILTGGTVISDERDLKLEDADLSMLGQCVKISIDKDYTTIVSGKGDTEKIKARLGQIKDQIEKTSSDYEREKLQERLVQFFSGVAVRKNRRKLIIDI